MKELSPSGDPIEDPGEKGHDKGPLREFRYLTPLNKKGRESLTRE